MDVLSPELYLEGPSDTYPLLMEQTRHSNSSQHVIDLDGSTDASTSTSPHERYFSGLDTSEHDDGHSNAGQSVSPSSASNRSNSRNSPSLRREETHRHRNPLNSGFWISIELFLTVTQIVTSILVLSLSRHEHRSPLFQWIVGYTCGCVAILPLLYWRYYHGIQIQEQGLSQPHQTSPRINVSSGTYVSMTRVSGGDGQATTASSRGNQVSWLMNSRYCFVIIVAN